MTTFWINLSLHSCLCPEFAVEVQIAVCVQTQAQKLWNIIMQFLMRERKKPSHLVIVKIVIGFPFSLLLMLLLDLSLIMYLWKVFTLAVLPARLQDV